jgi:hypothetical protein
MRTSLRTPGALASSLYRVSHTPPSVQSMLVVTREAALMVPKRRSPNAFVGTLVRGRGWG